jgi:putative acetyltransferase
MIRKHKPNDLEDILNIWSKASTLAHPFLETSFVEKVKCDMRNLYIPNSETWVYEENNIAIGFISMIENEIGGLFVLPDYHSKGIGTKLVNYIQECHNELEVEVFEKNHIGKAFYNKLGFKQINKFFHAESNTEVLRLKLN